MPKTLKKILTPFASLKLTVVLMAMSLVLIFSGTWAQIDRGIWSVMREYFRSPGVWIPFQIFLPRSWQVPGGVPFPGGYIIGPLLLLNLLAAHAVRFKVNWQRIGILLIHAALILLLIGEGITAVKALETQMPIYEGQTSNWTHDIHEVELAVIDHSNPEFDHVVVVPQALLMKADVKDQIVQHDHLPFDINVEQYMVNCELAPLPTNRENQLGVTHGFGLMYDVRQIQEVSGVGEQMVNFPAVIMTLAHGGHVIGRYLVTLWFQSPGEPYKFSSQVVSVGDKQYSIYLRMRRYYKPYSIKLINFKHDLYPGTEIPKNFSSEINLVDVRHHEDRNIRIYMNHPLRYRGETFFQSAYLPGDRGTILQVVNNPGWTIPYISCTMGALGMLIHFSMLLMRFLRRNKL